jgi:hypothetical protein
MRTLAMLTLAAAIGFGAALLLSDVPNLFAAHAAAADRIHAASSR